MYVCVCVCVCVCVYIYIYIYIYSYTHMTNIAMMPMSNTLRSRGAQISSLGCHEMKFNDFILSRVNIDCVFE